jgi:peptide/nickel transport system permease protein
VTGLVFISVFSFGLGWFPASGARSPLSVVLPAITLSLPVGAIFFQVFSAAIREAESSNYVFTADVKGLSRLAVFAKHVLPSAMLPSVTSIGLLVGFLAGGTAVVETVFSRDGIGRVVVAAVQARDVNVIQGVIVVVAVIYALAALLVDLSYPLLDPRLRTRVTGKEIPVEPPRTDAVTVIMPGAALPGEPGSGDAAPTGREGAR